MIELSNLALFVVGLAVTIPAATVVIALVFAAGIDERAEKKRRIEEGHSVAGLSRSASSNALPGRTSSR